MIAYTTNWDHYPGITAIRDRVGEFKQCGVKVGDRGKGKKKNFWQYFVMEYDDIIKVGSEKEISDFFGFNGKSRRELLHPGATSKR